MTTQLASVPIKFRQAAAPQEQWDWKGLTGTHDAGRTASPAYMTCAVAAAAAPLGEGLNLPFELLTLVLNEISHGILLVTEAAQVCFANRAALKALESTKALVLDRDRLVPSNPAENSTLIKALKACGSGKRSMMALQDAGDHGITIALVPLVGVADEHATSIRAMVVLGRRHAFDPLALQFYAKAHELTYSESNVLQRLCEGFSPGEISTRNKLADSTIRTHIRNLRQKTEARNIRDMVSQVMKMPPMASSFGNVLEVPNRFKPGF